MTEVDSTVPITFVRITFNNNQIAEKMLLFMKSQLGIFVECRDTKQNAKLEVGFKKIVVSPKPTIKIIYCSVYFAIVGRFLVGVSDSLLQPSVNSLLTRWFPSAERSYALGLATGGRQLGFFLTLILLTCKTTKGNDKCQNYSRAMKHNHLHLIYSSLKKKPCLCISCA